MSGLVREEALADGWEMVIGLEVHVELGTATKLFCGCANRFGDEPNTNVCPVCLGLPGSLPVPNAAAVESAMRLGRALGCEVRAGVFARKNYFYPDMPKDYQISQYDRPTNIDGALELPDGVIVGIERVHIEEDTGKTTHIGLGGRIHDADHALVDYNRAGVPLVEIVSRPDIRTVEQARAYVRELRAILLATGVSDARMEEGSMRVDANVSVRPLAEPDLRTRCEIKNLSSLRSLGRALLYEAHRHVDLWDSGERPRQETRHWDESSGRTTPGRSKEDADDYRYFQDPDLVPLMPSAAAVNAIDEALPPLPAARRAALVDAGAGAISAQVAELLVERDQDSLARAAITAGADAGLVATRISNDLAPQPDAQITAARLAAVIAMESAGRLTASQCKQVLAEAVHSEEAPEAIADRLGFHALAADDLEATVAEIIAANPDEWARYCQGDESDSRKMAGFLTGQVMRATKGRADGKAVARILTQKSQTAAKP